MLYKFYCKISSSNSFIF